MSLSGSSDSRCSSCATIRFAIWSSTGRAEEDDPLVEQAGVDVERALAARGLLDHHRDQRAHAGSLLTGGPQLRLGLGLFLVGRPDRLARLAPARAGSASPRRRPGRAPRAGAGPRAGPRAGRGCHSSSITSSASSPAASACSRTSAFTSSSETSIPSLSATASSTSSRATDSAASSCIDARQLLGRPAGELQVGLGRDPAPLERADEAGQELARARLDERARRR